MPVQTSARIASFQMRNGPGPSGRRRHGQTEEKKESITMELIIPPVPDISCYKMTRTRITALAAAGSESGSDGLTGHDSQTDHDFEAIVFLYHSPQVWAWLSFTEGQEAAAAPARKIETRQARGRQ